MHIENLCLKGKPTKLPEGKDTYKSPNYGGKLGHGIFHIIIKLFGVIPAYILLAFLIPYYVLILKKPRESASFYLRHRFPKAGKIKILFFTLYYFFEFGKVLIDQGALGILGRKKFTIKFPKWESLLKTAQMKKGIILLTSHIGSWQSAMSTMFNLGLPVHFLLQIDEHTSGRHFFDLAEQKDLFHIISPKTYLGGMIEMTNALLNRECVAIMGDRAWGAKTIDAKFLNDTAFFPITPYQLAVSTKADLIVMLTSRTGRLSFQIEYQNISEGIDLEKIPKEEAVNILLNRYINCIENHLSKYPFTWFNFFNIWGKNIHRFFSENLL